MKEIRRFRHLRHSDQSSGDATTERTIREIPRFIKLPEFQRGSVAAVVKIVEVKISDELKLEKR